MAQPPPARPPNPEPPEWLDGGAAARAAAAERDDLDAEAAERARIAAARTPLPVRWAAAEGRTVTVELLGRHRIVGEVLEAWPDAVWLRTGGQDVLVVGHAVVTASGLPGAADDSAHSLGRAGLGGQLRRVAASRRPVGLLLADGRRVDGTVGRVWADAVDLSCHPVDRPMAADDPVVTVPWSALSAVAVPL